MKNKIVLCLIIILALFFIFNIPVYAETSVYDYADLLTPEQENSLQYNSDQYDISIIFLTTNNANGLTTKKYANRFYDSHNFSDNGVLFVIDMDNREIYVDTVGACIKALDSKIESILDVGYEHIIESDYYGTLSSMFDVSQPMLQYCRAGAQISDKPIIDWKYVLTPTEGSIFLSILITIAILAIFIFIHNKENKTIKSTAYLSDNDGFVINSSNVTYLGDRRNVIHGYYNRSSSSSSGGRSGGRSGGGRSHGGGGRRF